MKTIIVPTDFSPVSVNAMNYAADMALSINASITLLHVYQVPVSYTDTQAPLPVIDVADIEELNRIELENTKANLVKVTGGAIEVNTELRFGLVDSELEDLCESLVPFAVIMGTRGAGLMERLFLGSTALSVIRKIKTPLLIVPPGGTFKGISKIVFACDFKAVKETIPAASIVSWVNTFGAELLVLNVDQENKNFNPDTPEQSVVLHKLIKDAKPRYYFIENDNIESGISEFAEEHNADLILTVPKKQKLLDVLFQRSHTTKLAIHSHIPLLSVYEGE